MTAPAPDPGAKAVLTIDLGAICENYHILRRQLNGVECAAVVKADGYGLGAVHVGAALAKAGCRTFFVAQLDEGIALRDVVGDAEIHILNGLAPNAEDVFRAHQLIPVLGSLHDIDIWQAYSRQFDLPCDIHVDTGMLRLGLPPDELQQIADSPDRIAGLNINTVLSHLASADEPQSTQTGAQLQAFKQARRILPMARASLANSSGVFWGQPFHYDLARPGVALYGVNPTPFNENPMRPCITLLARVVQIRNASTGETVGYGATHKLTRPSKIATLAVGYADGYLRSLSDKAYGYMGETKIPLVGRVSMDLITFDVTDVPGQQCHPGAWVELIGSRHSVDDLAHEAGTIGYEVLTSLGNRYHRIYKND